MAQRLTSFVLLTVHLCGRPTASSTEVSTTVQTTCWGTGFPLLWSSALHKSLFVSQVLATDFQYNHNDKAQWAENSLEQSITTVLFWECSLACELHSLYQTKECPCKPLLPTAPGDSCAHQSVRPLPSSFPLLDNHFKHYYPSLPGICKPKRNQFFKRVLRYLTVNVSWLTQL